MTQIVQVLPEKTSDAPFVEVGGAAPQGATVNPVLKVHQFLAGRYHWAILLGLLLSAIAGVIAHTLVVDPYKSTGAIQIKPYLTRIIYQSEQSNVMPMFDAYVETQASILQSQRTVMLAMESAEWKVAVRKSKPHDLALFTDSLEVTHPRSSELVQISFSDPDATLAPVAVKAVIEAYMRIAGENDTDSYSKKLQILEDRRATLTSQLKGLNDRILAIANEFGTDDLDRIYLPKLEEYNRLISSLAEADILLAYAHADANATSAPAGGTATAPAVAVPETQPQVLTPELVARRGDARMARLIAERDQEQQTLSRLLASYGQSHPAVRPAVIALGVTQDAIAELLLQYQAAATQPATQTLPGASAAVDDPAAVTAGVARKQAEFRVAELKARSEKAKTELLDIGRKELQIRNLKSEIDAVQKNLDEAKARIDQLGVESLVSGRTTTLSTGDIPFRPAKKRNLPATVAGSFGGFFLGVALIALIGAFDRRLKSVADAQKFVDRSNRLLGILPALPEDLSDPDQAAAAAYCVHHIRTLLQLGSGAAPHSVIAVTSSSPGEGKTSLVLSLGHSYAAAGVKTLLIDFDIIGAGLSSRSSAIVRRRLGDILLREKLLTPAQLDTALACARKTGKHLGETLLDLHLIEPDALKRAQNLKNESNLGLLDVLDGEPIANCIMNSGPNNLAVLPTGNLGSQHAGQVSLKQVQRILQEARESYEVVLIDTGPVLGSLESCVVAAVADEVILVVARGQDRPMIDKSLARLAEIGAKIAGVVFNRAVAEDLEQSPYSSYRTSQRLPELPDADDSQGPEGSNGSSNGTSNGSKHNGSKGNGSKGNGSNGHAPRLRRLGPIAQAVVRDQSVPAAPAKDAP